MKSRVLMATLIVTLMLGARIYAGDCGPCDPACDPCGACTSCCKSCDLFSGLKKLAACNPCDQVADCGPCDGVVACSPCDVADCDPCGACGDLGCNARCGKKFTFGKRLRDAFVGPKGCDPCGPCDTDCGPCDDVACCDSACDPCGACDTGCNKERFTFRKFFRGFRVSGKCGDACCDPCGACDTGCGNDCGACDACDLGCDPCGDVACDPCGSSCAPKYGRLFDKPRRNVKKFFDGLFSDNGCNPCDPCGTGSCDPCEPVCNACGSVDCYHGAPATSQLPEVVN